MNKHIKLVKRYLAGENVTTEELRANSDSAAEAADVAYAAAEAAYWVDAHAQDANNAATAAEADASGDALGDAEAAAQWVKRYEELIGE